LDNPKTGDFVEDQLSIPLLLLKKVDAIALGVHICAMQRGSGLRVICWKKGEEEWWRARKDGGYNGSREALWLLPWGDDMDIHLVGNLVGSGTI
jgi:hypothetical protein